MLDSLFSWDRFFDAAPTLLSYFPVTLEMMVFAEIPGILLGLLIATIRLRHVPVLDQFFVVYISFMRGTPIIVQMLIVLYGLPMVAQSLLGVNIARWDKIVFVIIALALNEGAFLSEIFRSSINSVSPVQTEAGLSVGMTWGETFRRIVLPQAARIAIPAYGTNLVSLLQSTSVAYMIGVIDMVARAQTIATATLHSLEVFTFVTVVYVICSLVIRGLFSLLSRRLGRPVVRAA